MVLFTADWQMAYSNLTRIEQTTDQILNLCLERDISAVFNLGDLKHSLNPLDVRVLNAAIRMIEKFRADDIDYYLLLGNHDLTSASGNAENWFPALERAGAIVIDEPKTINISDEYMNDRPFHCIPYMADNQLFRAAAKDHASVAQKNSVLCFHQMIRGARLNPKHKADDPSDPALDELFPEQYAAVFGGHVHLPQKLGSNCFYVGSPFAHDWGEVNQQKVFMLLSGKKTTAIRSDLPGWYDPNAPGYHKPKSFKGANVRIFVPVDTKAGVANALTEEKAKAENTYRGASITLIPQVLSEGFTSSAKSGLPEAKAIQRYIAKTVPLELEKGKKRIYEYIQGKLKEVAGDVRNAEGVEFLKASGKNVLCFDEIEIDFSRKGITVISGVNGSGKSSLLHILSIALFGNDLKGQSHDAWVKRKSKGGAWVSLDLKLPDGRTLTIFRQRKPAKLTLSINGVEQASGRTVQKDIETLTGLTWDLLCNAIYIDQKEMSTLLSGTDGERKTLIAQILNLEKYQRARDLAREDLSQARSIESELGSEKDKVDTTVQLTQEQLAQMEEVSWDVSKLTKGITSLRRNITKNRQALEALKNTLRIIEGKHEPLVEKRVNLANKLAEKKAEISVHSEALRKIQRLSGNCPTCHQKITRKHISSCGEALSKEIQTRTDAFNALNEEFDAVLKLESKEQKKLFDARSRMEGVSRMIVEFEAAKSNKEAIIEKAKKLAKRIKEKREWLAKLEAEQAKLERRAKSASGKVAYLEYIWKALSKKEGIPAYLSGELCPRLTQAAAYYSELFSGGLINVSFSLEDDSIDVQVDNQFGGEGVRAQSQGEGRIASLIVSLALRDVCSPSNLLIADEPGEGLDEENARLFSQVLLDIKDRFETVWITTHNPFIQSGLSGERQISMVKKNGSSRLET